MSVARLIRIMRRLEAATSRLEDMAQATIDPGASTNGIPSHSATAGETIGGAAGSLAPPAVVRQAEPLPASIEAFDELILSDVTKFVNISDELGGVVAEQVRCYL